MIAVVARRQHQHAGAVADRILAHAHRPVRSGDGVAGRHRVLDAAAGRIDVEDAFVDVHAIGHRRGALHQRGEIAADLALVAQAHHAAFAAWRHRGFDIGKPEVDQRPRRGGRGAIGHGIAGCRGRTAATAHADRIRRAGIDRCGLCISDLLGPGIGRCRVGFRAGRDIAGIAIDPCIARSQAQGRPVPALEQVGLARPDRDRIATDRTAVLAAARHHGFRLRRYRFLGGSTRDEHQAGHGDARQPSQWRQDADPGWNHDRDARRRNSKP